MHVENSPLTEPQVHFRLRDEGDFCAGLPGIHPPDMLPSGAIIDGFCIFQNGAFHVASIVYHKVQVHFQASTRNPLLQ
jgi:hypothetical protein